MKSHLTGQSPGHSLNECIVMSYYLLPPVNHHQQADLFSFYNYDDRPIKSQIQTRSLVSRDVEIANLTAKNYTLLDVQLLSKDLSKPYLQLKIKQSTTLKPNIIIVILKS